MVEGEVVDLRWIDTGAPAGGQDVGVRTHEQVAQWAGGIPLELGEMRCVGVEFVVAGLEEQDSWAAVAFGPSDDQHAVADGDEGGGADRGPEQPVSGRVRQ